MAGIIAQASRRKSCMAKAARPASRGWSTKLSRPITLKDGTMLATLADARSFILALRSASMSEADQFRQYAEEAKRWVRQSKTENEKQVLIELARTWTQAAAESERSVAVN
jgi:hypothetical protein